MPDFFEDSYQICTRFVEKLLSSDDKLQTIKFSSPKTIVPGSISIKKLANSFCQANVARNKMIVAKRSEITLWCLFSERFEDKVVELRSNDKKLMDQIARKQIRLSLWKINVRKLLSKMSGKCHVRSENVWKISHASKKCPEYYNILDRQYSGKRPEYCNIPDIFWTQTFSGRLFFIGIIVCFYLKFVGKLFNLIYKKLIIINLYS